MRRGVLLGLVASVALASLAGCGPQPTRRYRPAAPSYLPAPPAELLLHALVVDGPDGPVRASLDEPLATGERFALVVSASECLHVYVLNRGSDGRERVIWPHVPTCLGTSSARLPQGSWFELEPPAGPELLALVATRQEVPLTEAGQAHLQALVKAVELRRDLVRVQGAHPPGFVGDRASAGFRAAGLRPADEALVIPTEDGEAVLLVDLDHRPREPEPGARP